MEFGAKAMSYKVNQSGEIICDTAEEAIAVARLMRSGDETPHKESIGTKPRGAGRLLLRGKVWWICWYENGEERRESTAATNEEEAQRLLAEVVKGVTERKAQKFTERVGLVRHGSEGIKSLTEAAEVVAPPAKRRGRPPMITREMVDKAIGDTDGDPKCSRSSCVHTKSQHVGPNGKCVGCWCYGFVEREQFARA